MRRLGDRAAAEHADPEPPVLFHWHEDLLWIPIRSIRGGRAVFEHNIVDRGVDDAARQIGRLARASIKRRRRLWPSFSVQTNSTSSSLNEPIPPLPDCSPLIAGTSKCCLKHVKILIVAR
jgi:hypothetical protein